MFDARAARLFVSTLLGSACAILVGHFIVYRLLVVPLLSGVQSVPPWLWLLQYAPEVAAVTWAGTWLRSWRGVCGLAVACSVLRVVLMFGLAASHQPGHLKSFEAPGVEALVLLCLWLVGYGALLVAGRNGGARPAQGE